MSEPKMCGRHDAPVSNACDERCVYEQIHTRPTACGRCGGVIGPDVTNRPMCYGCGPLEMIPAGILANDERARRRSAEAWP